MSLQVRFIHLGDTEHDGKWKKEMPSALEQAQSGPTQGRRALPCHPQDMQLCPLDLLPPDPCSWLNLCGHPGDYAKPVNTRKEEVRLSIS